MLWGELISAGEGRAYDRFITKSDSVGRLETYLTMIGDDTWTTAPTTKAV